MAPPEQRDLVEMSLGLKPMSGPMAVMVMLREAVIRAGVTWNHAEPTTPEDTEVLDATD
jgi:hypothetical protein